ncbi:hypothetical protein LJC60_00560 [Ruminococcaceae bacterium OttesenSCG-928-D13]|nr:hypothetical protein [Ruminococcaceae bacterium OttesenSCG-928-D13]
MPLSISNVVFLTPTLTDAIALVRSGFKAIHRIRGDVQPFFHDIEVSERVIIFPALGEEGESWADETIVRLRKQGIPNERIKTMRVTDFTLCIPKDEGLGVDCLISTFCGTGESDLIGDIYAAAVGE